MEQRVFVILYEPGYGDSNYLKGAFSSRKRALDALKADKIYENSREHIDFEIEELTLNELV